jgi:DNA-binding winged helix-turn-helix (wHTH) protein
VTLYFGEFTVDAGARRVLRAGCPVHLSPKAFDLLVVLLQVRPRVLSKAELHQHLWPDTFVTDASLAMLVAEVRAAIGDSARQPRWVRTVHRRGYAFQAAAVPPSASGDELTRAASSPRLWLVAPPHRAALVAGSNIVGRDPDCHVWIDAPSVSRRHARVLVEDDRVTVEDLGSKNGTSIGGRSIGAPSPLAVGETVRFGAIPMVLRARPEDPTLTEGGS